jgi:hypothetical protein
MLLIDPDSLSTKDGLCGAADDDDERKTNGRSRTLAVPICLEGFVQKYGFESQLLTATRFPSLSHFQERYFEKMNPVWYLIGKQKLLLLYMPSALIH